MDNSVAIRYETGDARPGGGEGYIEGNHFNFKRPVTVRYETGDARPRGEDYISALLKSPTNERAEETSKTRSLRLSRREFTNSK